MHLIKILLSIIILVFGQSCKSTKTKSTNNSLPSGVHRIVISPGSDVKKSIESAVNKYSRVIISFVEGEEYEINDIIITKNCDIKIEGNNATIKPKKGLTSASLFTFIDPKSLTISNLTIDGNYKNVDIEKHLLKIHTPANKTAEVIIDNITVQNGDNGGIMVHNIYPPNKIRNYTAGAASVKITNCKFHNVGSFSAINLRGSHRNVLVQNCIGTDKLSRLHYSQGKMFAVSAEVQEKDDCLGNVTFNNCTIRNSNGSLFAQKVKTLTISNFRVDSLGHNPVLYPSSQKKVGVVAFKIDDLGKNNKAVIESFYVTNTADLPYRAFLALEESGGQGSTSNVVVNYFESDVPLRLGAGGNHKILGGKIFDASINLYSKGNLIQNVSFFGKEERIGIRLLSTDNSIEDCSFYNSTIINYPQAKSNTIKNSRLLKGDLLTKWIIFDLNNPQDPNSFKIENCSAVTGVLGVWSGGLPQQSKNLEINISQSPTISLSKNITSYSNIQEF